MIKLSKNFSRKEFTCKCGCGFDTVDCELIIVVQDVRDYFDKRTNISSGCRCKMYNRMIEGELFSKHMWGQAADIAVIQTHPSEVYAYLDKKYSGKYGVGGYSGHTHIDVRSDRPWRQVGMASK